MPRKTLKMKIKINLKYIIEDISIQGSGKWIRHDTYLPILAKSLLYMCFVF